jgi:hypothetical protein
MFMMETVKNVRAMAVAIIVGSHFSVRTQNEALRKHFWCEEFEAKVSRLQINFYGKKLSATFHLAKIRIFKSYTSPDN